MKYCSLIVAMILLTLPVITFAQINSFFKPKPVEASYKSLSIVEGTAQTYKHKESYCLTGLELFKDSSFVYYDVSISKYDFTVGKYSLHDHVLSLTWDSLKSYTATADAGFYGKYFRFNVPQPFKITQRLYTMESKKINGFVLKQKETIERRIEIFYYANDFLKKGFLIDSFISINYNNDGSKLIIKKEGSNKEISFKKDTVWGYKIYDKGNCSMYRKVPKGLYWNTSPGIEIVQMDSLVIYQIGSGYNYCYFSKDLQSSLFPLSIVGIKEAFKDNENLVIELTKGQRGLNYSFINKETHNFKIIEAYRKFYNNL